ncbi:DnaD domain-containing protein [Parvimonas micra]|uniref:DNA replication protein DnaD n=1 Tax=Parvimonas micra TaxID=33033 RepID=A0A0B4S048_9FIRM|nr:DnaD domain protein [Parvimonas micra]AIZ36041.1 DNA replication protein DnaD [Parvimonas micra]MCZ7408235.1 DnaD domain protein [Parvimonas micra]MCZ7411322.1 DnaD domain protein [Parvimonas micra]MCZ7412832.1 DnaD domain protein [Parvimonas micra]WBB36835.1 DnaD domain protein [Parvimonas micra]
MEISFKKSIIQPGVTPIENMFLDNYLSIVDEISLKVYLFLYKRLFGSYKSELSIKFIAEELRFSEVQIMNALKYWKNNQLLDYSLNEDGCVEKIEFVNNFALYAGGIYDDNVEEEKEKPMIDNREYFEKIEEITGLSLKPYEITKIISHIEETGHGMDLVYKAYEYAKSIGKSMSVDYIIGILRAWKRDNNILTVEDLKYFLENKDKNKIKRYSKNTKKYIEKEHILTEEEKREKMKNDDNSATLELLDRY